jgi:CRP/FNR family transcriptional regulator, cyclic AMP receptor protein
MPDVFSTVYQNLMLSLSSAAGLVQFTATVLGLGLLVAASFVRTMVPLRAITVISNILLLTAGLLASSPVHILVYLGLIPLNTWRLMEIQRLTRRVVKASADGDLSGIWLKPYMKPLNLPAGAVLFKKGDPADSLYLLVEGELELTEIGKRQKVGELFGEISFFSPDRRRTLEARCVTDCVVLCIGEKAFKQLYFQHPKFAFQISNLIADRLSADIGRLQQRVASLEAEAPPPAAALVPAAAAAGLQPAGT